MKLTREERVQEATQILRSQVLTRARMLNLPAPKCHVDLINTAVDAIDAEEIKRREHSRLQDHWRDRLRDFEKTLVRARKQIKSLRPALVAPAEIDALAVECESWIAHCKRRLRRRAGKGGWGSKPRRDDGAGKWQAAALAKHILIEHGLPADTTKRGCMAAALAAVLYGHPNANLAEYCRPHVAKAAGTTARSPFDFRKRTRGVSG
jgi:hypothetical protein